MAVSGELIIVARSGRALAQSACRAGWRPRVIDAFGDVDTLACGREHARVSMDGEGLLDEQNLSAALAALSESRGARLVYGAGVECLPELVERLSADYAIAGNTADTLRAVKDPITLCAALRALRIPCPAIRFTPPEADADTGQIRGWLVKRAGSAGGGHVRRWDGGPLPAREHYFQRFLPGPVMSALFAADGHRARLIGYNTQRTTSLPAQPFAYGGAVNRARLTPEQRAMVARQIADLTRAFGLRGLNGLDFVLHGNQPTVLEVNARPTATCELYEPDASDGMVAIHVRACEGWLPEHSTVSATMVRAHAIVYAEEPRWVPAKVRWPSWCRDLPAAGSYIAVGEPVCSVHAEGADVEFVRRMVDARRDDLLTLLNLQSAAA